MFNGKLYKFQDKHEINLLKKCADHEEMVLCAPTGSGKTVIVSKFIDDYLDENPKTVFLWLCPGAGGLQKQSQDSFSELISGVPYGDVYSFITEPDVSGHVFFINWDKINKKSNVVLREGEQQDLMSKVLSCHTSGVEIFMIIDEEHKYRETANEYRMNIQPKHVLRVSATPISQGNHVETITDDEVIASGLIASAISINEGLSQAIQENNNLDDDLLLIELADKKRKEIQKIYESLGVNVRPLVLIQFPNGSEEWIERVKDTLEKMGYPKNSNFVASWFSGDHPDNPEEIKKLNGQYAFLLFKQAIATGWDCPRAKILVKLREGGTERFNVQTVGRIRRMPERKHYGLNIVDNCYLYTLDNQFTDGLTSSITDYFYSYQYKRKFQAPNIILEKEVLNGSDRFAVNPEAVVLAVRKKFLEECDLDGNGILDKYELSLSKGFTFGTILKTTAIEGVARTTHDILSLNKIFGGEHEIDNHADGFIIRDAKRKIASAMRIDENISNNALQILFGPEDTQMSLLSQEEKDFEHNNKLLIMNKREYNAFLINNRDLLIDILCNIDQEDLGEIRETDVVRKDWSIPSYQYYSYNKKVPVTKFMEKNVFSNYGNNILVSGNGEKGRSVSEIKFEEWCENPSSPVQWLYKNGDKGDDFFSIVYRMTYRRANFYPDYIIQCYNGDIWIIEAKGGMNADGSSNNIDTNAKNKFDALKDYSLRYPNVKWGFVRAFGSQLYISNTIWTEDLTDSNVWKPIEDYIK